MEDLKIIMETLKNISFNIVLCLIGAIFAFFGLSGGFFLNNYCPALNDTWPRIVSTLIGIVLASFAIYIEIKQRSATLKTNAETDGKNNAVAAKQSSIQTQDFFLTLEDLKDTDHFSTIIKDAVRVKILARTMVNLLNQYKRNFEQMGKKNCEIKLLLVDPLSDASKFLYGSDPEVYKDNITLAVQNIKNLKHKLGTRLEVRVIKHAPTVSILAIEKQENANSFMQIQLYFLHSAVGRGDRPIFHVQYADKWYKVFQEEFEQLWSGGVEWDYKSFSEK